MECSCGILGSNLCLSFFLFVELFLHFVALAEEKLFSAKVVGSKSLKGVELTPRAEGDEIFKGSGNWGKNICPGAGSNLGLTILSLG